MLMLDADAATHTAAGKSCDKKQFPKTSMLTAVDTNQVDDETMLMLTDADCKLTSIEVQRSLTSLHTKRESDGDRQC